MWRTSVRFRVMLALLMLVSAGFTSAGAEDELDTSYGDGMIMDYFSHRVDETQGRWLEGIDTLEDWEARREEMILELREMLGLRPWPERTPLEVEITGTIEHELFTVEKFHFQPSPEVYITANLYLPRDADGPVPAVLYACGHSRQDEFGPKTADAYQRQAAWYAEQGMASLIVDTLQLGEIRGVHNGPRRDRDWWWHNRGYTPLGFEVWIAMRALDYMEERPEIDNDAIAMTGRSGGGLYSWYTMALDDRVKVSVPVAGLTDLRNHIVDPAVAHPSHCDCNFFVNSYGWDFPMVPALHAPRPTRLANTDADAIFPLDGVERIGEQVREIYRLYDAEENWDVWITEGGHESTPELREGSFRWIYKHLTGEELDEVPPSTPHFEREQLQVFTEGTPDDARNESVQEWFVPAANTPEIPENAADWETLRGEFLDALDAYAFNGWPEVDETALMNSVDSTGAMESAGDDTRQLTVAPLDFESQQHATLRMWIIWRSDSEVIEEVDVHVVDGEGYSELLAVLQSAFGEDAEAIIGEGARAVEWPDANDEGWTVLADELGADNKALAVVAPRGIGPTRWDLDGYTRYYMLAGQSRDAMRIWDVRQAMTVLRRVSENEPEPGYPDARGAGLNLVGKGDMAGIALYAALFTEEAERLDLHGLPASHRTGPTLLHVRKTLDLPQTVAMAATEIPVTLRGAEDGAADWAEALLDNLGKAEQLTVE